MTLNVPVVNLPYSSITGLGLARASDTTLTLAHGQARDSQNIQDIVLPSDVTINAAVNGINGLDTGTFAASKIYYVYVVMDQTGLQPTGGLLSLSAVTPTLPGLYSTFRRVGSWYVNASTHFVTMYQSGAGSARTMYYQLQVATGITAGASTTAAQVDLTNIVPAVAGTEVIMASAYTPHAASETLVLSPDSTITTPLTITGQVASVIVTSTNKLPITLVSGAPSVYYAVSVATSPAAAALKVQGFVDYV